MEVFQLKKDCLFDLVVVGACFCDLQTYVEKYPKPGQTVYGRKFQMDFGGKGANTCVMAAKLGAKTSMISLVGDDVFGRETIENFHKFGVNTECLGVTTEAATPMTNCIVGKDGEPSFISIRGASKCLTTAHVNDAKHVIEQGKFLITNMGIPLSTALESLKLGKQCGAITIYNPAPSVTELPDEFYPNTDVLMLNMNEATALTKASVTARSEAEVACTWFHEKGVLCVVLTMGENGAIVSVNGLDNSQGKYPGRTLFHVPSRKANVVDMTGAGDALAGAFSFFLSCYPHLSLKEIVTRSVAIATRTVETEGVQKSYPSRESLPSELFD